MSPRHQRALPMQPHGARDAPATDASGRASWCDLLPAIDRSHGCRATQSVVP